MKKLILLSIIFFSCKNYQNEDISKIPKSTVPIFSPSFCADERNLQYCECKQTPTCKER